MGSAISAVVFLAVLMILVEEADKTIIEIMLLTAAMLVAGAGILYFW